MRVQADVRAPRVLTLARRRCAGGERALLIAAKAGREDLVELIAGFKADVNVSDASGKTALHFMSEQGKIDMVQILVKVGANVEAKDKVSLKRETLTRAQTDTLMPCRQGHVRMHWRGGCIAREGAHATVWCSMPACCICACARTECRVPRAGEPSPPAKASIVAVAPPLTSRCSPGLFHQFALRCVRIQPCGGANAAGARRRRDGEG